MELVDPEVVFPSDLQEQKMKLPTKQFPCPILLGRPWSEKGKTFSKWHYKLRGIKICMNELQ